MSAAADWLYCLTAGGRFCECACERLRGRRPHPFTAQEQLDRLRTANGKGDCFSSSCTANTTFGIQIWLAQEDQKDLLQSTLQTWAASVGVVAFSWDQIRNVVRKFFCLRGLVVARGEQCFLLPTIISSPASFGHASMLIKLWRRGDQRKLKAAMCHGSQRNHFFRPSSWEGQKRWNPYFCRLE